MSRPSTMPVILVWASLPLILSACTTSGVDISDSTARAQVSGVVTDPAEVPVSSATITVQLLGIDCQFEARGPETVFTDADGRYEMVLEVFADSPTVEGCLEIRVEPETTSGLQPKDTTDIPIQLRTSEPVQRLEVDLELEAAE